MVAANQNEEPEFQAMAAYCFGSDFLTTTAVDFLYFTRKS